jgi:dTMP kinase
VTLEGPDGSGKTHVAAVLHADLAARGLAVRLTREPGGTAIDERIRAILLEHAPNEAPLSPRADALLFAAARAQHVAEIVLCARFADSSLAYQGYGLGLPLAAVRDLQAFATDGCRPDLTILLDLPVEVGLARKQDNEQTRFEAGFDLAYHRRVRDGFLELAAAEPDRFFVIDATATIEDVEAAARDAVLRLIGSRQG